MTETTKILASINSKQTAIVALLKLLNDRLVDDSKILNDEMKVYMHNSIDRIVENAYVYDQVDKPGN